MEDSKLGKDLEDFLKSEIKIHIDYKKALVRGNDSCFKAIEEKAKKIMLKTESLISEDDFVFLHYHNNKIKFLNYEFVKVNSRIMLIMQTAISLGVDLDLDTTDQANVGSIAKEDMSSFLFYDEGLSLKFKRTDIDEMCHNMSVDEVRAVGIQKEFDTLKKDMELFKSKKNASKEANGQ